MTTIATVESLWRYPVKSMCGETMNEMFMGFSGIYGDRCYAFKNSSARAGFPYLSATAQERMLRFRPHFRHPEKSVRPPNLFEAMSIAPGVNAADAEPEDLSLDIETPAGERLAINDPALAEMLVAGLRGENRLTLVRSDRALTDCRPVSLISRQTVRQIEAELGFPVDLRRFRANVCLDLFADEGFAEDALVGRRLRFGPRAEVMILERDPRCKMISLDPETGAHDPAVLRLVAQRHANYAGLYAAVLVEGILKPGEPIELLD